MGEHETCQKIYVAQRNLMSMYTVYVGETMK